jgi:tape measure domain-containing protein
MNSNLNLSLTLRAVDHLTAPLRRINSQIETLKAPVRNFGQELSKSLHLTGLTQVREGLAGIGREAGALTFKLAAMGGAAGFAFKNMFIDVAAEYENLAVSLEAVEGSAEKGKKAMAWIADFAKTTPLELDTTTKAYTMLKNAGINPMNGSLMALVDSNAKINGSQENMIEITRQLGQAWMKNKLQMEEVNVLTERGTKVVPLLAKAMGKNEAAIMAMISKGKIGRKEIALLIEAMGKDAAGAAEKQSRTWTGMMSTLTDTWKGTVNTLMTSSGSFDFLKGKLDAFIKRLDFLQTPEGMKEIDAYGKKLYATLEAIANFSGQAWEKINQLAQAVGGFGNLAKIAFGTIAAVMAGPLLLAITSVVGGLATLTTVMLANPLVLAIGLMSAAVYLLWKNWDAVVAGFKTGIDSVKNWFAVDLMAAIDHVFNGIKSGFSAFIDGIVGIDRAIKNIMRLKSPFSGGEPMFAMPEAPQSTSQASERPAVRAPVKPISPFVSLDVDKPVAPVAMGKPVEPVAMGKPVEPVAMGKPVAPVAMGKPVEPVAMGKPVEPVAMGKPVAPVAMGKPVAPVAMGKPVTPIALGKPVPTLARREADKVDVGGLLHIKIDQDGQAKVTSMKTNDPRMNYNVDAGLTMPGAR